MESFKRYSAGKETELEKSNKTKKESTGSETDLEKGDGEALYGSKE